MLTMQAFYSKAGEFLGHAVNVTGEFPKRACVVEFHYQHGRSTFDGQEWHFELFLGV